MYVKKNNKIKKIKRYKVKIFCFEQRSNQTNKTFAYSALKGTNAVQDFETFDERMFIKIMTLYGKSVAFQK